MFGSARDRLDELMALEREQPLVGLEFRELLRELAAVAFDSLPSIAEVGWSSDGRRTWNSWLSY